MAWEDPEPEDDDGVGGVTQALADPGGTFGDDEGGVPQSAPAIDERVPQQQQAPVSPEDEEMEQVARQPVPVESGDPAEDQQSGSEDPEEQMYTGRDLSPETETSPATDDEGGAVGGLKAPTVPGLPTYVDPTSKEHELESEISSFNPANYKPSGLRRAGAGIAAGLAAFGRNPNAMQIGEMALNGPLDRAKAVEAQKEAATRQQIADINAQNQHGQQQFANEGSEFNMGERDLRNQGYVGAQNARAQNQRAQAQAKANAITGFQPNDPSNPWKGGVGTTGDGRTLQNVPPPAAWLKDWSGTPDGKAALLHADVKTRLQVGVQIGLKGPRLQEFAANGKLTEPTTSFHFDMNADGSMKQRGPKDRESNISDLVAQSVNDKNAFTNAYHRVTKEEANDAAPEGSYINESGTTVLSPEEFRSKIDKFRTDANVKLTKYGAHLDDQGNLVREPGQPQLRPGQSPPAGGGAALPPPDKASFSLSKWKAANPKGDVEAARDAALKGGYKVVQ